jgi:hypothetical protein
VSFVPEGQHDSSQARSAWDDEENSPVPAGRLNRSWLRHGENRLGTFEPDPVRISSPFGPKESTLNKCSGTS